jgi:hypothetical protein
MSITVVEEDTFDVATAASTSSPSYYAYHTHGKSLDAMIADDFSGGVSFTAGTAKNYHVDADDLGMIVFWFYGGTADYVDVAHTLSANSWTQSRGNLDINNDKKPDYLFLADVSKAGKPDANNVAQNFIVKLATADVDSGTTMANTADKSSIGTGTKTNTITWKVSGFAQKTGVAISRVYVTHGANVTNEDLASVKSISVAYGSQEVIVSGSDIVYDSGGKTWYMYGSGDSVMDGNRRDLVDAMLCLRQEGGSEEIVITVTVETYFVTGTVGITLTCYCDLIKSDNTVYTTTLNDAVVMAK